VTVLQGLPSRSLYSVPVVGVQEMQQQTSFLANAKKRLREERHPFANISNCPLPDNTRTHKKRRPLGQAPSKPAGTPCKIPPWNSMEYFPWNSMEY